MKLTQQTPHPKSTHWNIKTTCTPMTMAHEGPCASELRTLARSWHRHPERVAVSNVDGHNSPEPSPYTVPARLWCCTGSRTGEFV